MKDLLEDIFIYNKIIIFNLFGFFRDINNFFYLRKSFKEISKNYVWQQKKFRLDWIGFGYGVFNYDEEFFKFPPEYQKHIITNDMQFLFEDFEKYNFLEILTLRQERIVIGGEETYSVLIYFRPIFYYISKWNVINTFILSLIFIYLFLF